jgi:hypothetical protein
VEYVAADKNFDTATPRNQKPKQQKPPASSMDTSGSSLKLERDGYL